MRKGISITVTAGDRVRLDAIIGDRNSPQKHVWRARIVLLTVDGNGTNTITRAVGKDKTSVWRWQERFMHEGIAGLIRDKTRPSRIAPLPAKTVDRVVALTNQAPPHEATHWSAPAMAEAVGISPSSVRRIWRGQGLQPHRMRAFKISNDPKSPTSSRMWSASMSTHQPMPWSSASTRKAKFRRSTAPSPGCR